MKKKVSKPEAKPEKLSKQKRTAFTAIEQQENELHEVGEDIWRYKELPGKEFQSHDCICAFLRKKGFSVTPNYMGIQTSFCATYGGEDRGGSPHPNVCFLCEYSADELTGHSKGHNLVTVVSLTAALGLQTVIKFSPTHLGKVSVIGCPGSIHNTSKIAMFEAGCFRGVDFILTAYPSHYTNTAPSFSGAKNFKVVYRGRSRKDGDRPWEVASPVNACVLAYQNVSALRQQFLMNWIVNGVIICGGKHANVLPETSTMEFIVKAPKPNDIKSLYDKINECFSAAAMATGCRVEVQPTLAEFLCNIHCAELTRLYTENATLNGFTFHNTKTELEQEDDVSNVSTVIPTMKVFYYAGSPLAAKVGTDEFNRYVGSKDAQFMSIVQGKTLAMMAVDLMTKPTVMRTIFEQHQEALLTSDSDKQESCENA